MFFINLNLPYLAVFSLIAGLYHLINHAIFKGLLFLCAGSVYKATGTRDIEKLGGLIKKMPQTAACFLLGAMAISALPPLNGFDVSPDDMRRLLAAMKDADDAALLAHCRVLTVTLWPTLEAAQVCKKRIDETACGGRCVRDHEIIDLESA